MRNDPKTVRGPDQTIQFKTAKYNIVISTSSTITHSLETLDQTYLKTNLELRSLLPCFHRALFRFGVRVGSVCMCVCFGGLIGFISFKQELSSTSYELVLLNERTVCWEISD